MMRLETFYGHALAALAVEVSWPLLKGDREEHTAAVSNPSLPVV